MREFLICWVHNVRFDGSLFHKSLFLMSKFRRSGFFGVFSFAVLFCRIVSFLVSESSYVTFIMLNIPGFLKRGCFFVFAPSLFYFPGRYYPPYLRPLFVSISHSRRRALTFLSLSSFFTIYIKNKQITLSKENLIM